MVAAARVGVPAREDAELVTDGVTGMAQVGAAAAQRREREVVEELGAPLGGGGSSFVGDGGRG